MGMLLLLSLRWGINCFFDIIVSTAVFRCTTFEISVYTGFGRISLPGYSAGSSVCSLTHKKAQMQSVSKKSGSINVLSFMYFFAKNNILAKSIY